MAASFIINSYLIRVFDFLIINLVGLCTFFAIQIFKDPELDLQRYAALMFGPFQFACPTHQPLAVLRA